MTGVVAKGAPTDIAHALMERAHDDPLFARLGPHVIRVVPVMGTCDASIAAVEALAAQLLPASFPAEGVAGKNPTFCVMIELHSPRIRDTTPQDLVRRVANAVPRSYRVDLTHAEKTIALLVVGQNVCMAVLSDWHSLHKYNLKRNQEEGFSKIC